MTLVDYDTNSIRLIMPIGQFWVDNCHVDGGGAQCGLGGHHGGRQGADGGGQVG